MLNHIAQHFDLQIGEKTQKFEMLLPSHKITISDWVYLLVMTVQKYAFSIHPRYLQICLK